MAIVLAALGVVWLVLDGTGVLEFQAPGDRPEAVGSGEMLDDLERELFEQVTGVGPGLEGLPGVEVRRYGEGAVTGVVALHGEDGADRPLPGVAVEIVGRRPPGRSPRKGASTPVRLTGQTDLEGRFTIPQVAAQGGYVLLVDHAPYRRLVLRGIYVRRDETTDVGTLTLGAPTTLAGRVTDAKGRSIAGAVVQVLRDASRGGSFDLRRALFELDGPSSPLAAGRVDEDGMFSIGDVPPGRYVLRVSAPGYATRFRSGVLVTVDENSSAVRVVLDRGAGFEGRVTDGDGNGLAGGRVIAAAMPGREMKLFDRVEVTTGPDGSYRIDTLVPGMRYALEAWAEGHAPTVRYIEVGSDVRTLDWALAGSGRIEGRVFDEETGVGVPDCQVTVLAGPITGISPVSTVTDEGGTFVLPYVNQGPIILFSAHAVGYQSNDELNLASVRGLRVVSGETTFVEWRLKAGGAVEGRVSTDGGAPVPYASIALVDRNAGRRRWTAELTAMSDAQGAYRVVGVRPGEYDVRVSAPGHAPPSDRAETHVTMGKALGSVTKDLVLRRGGTLQGTVTAPDGTALAGARIGLAPADGKTSRDIVRDLTAVSAANGSFTLRGVPPAVELLVHAEHDSWVQATPVRARVAPGATRKLTLRLREGATLTGRVADVRGAGVEGARVRWGHVEGVEPRDLRTSFEADAHLGSRVIRTDNDGRFRIEGLAPGTLLLKVELEGYAAWYRRDLRIGTEGPQPALAVELESTLTIRGRVTSRGDGRPLARAFVYMRERGPAEGEAQDPGRVQAVLSCETDAQGRYVLEGVPPGVHEVVVWFADGHVGAAQDRRNEHVRRRGVEAGASGVDFVLDALEPPAPPDGDTR